MSRSSRWLWGAVLGCLVWVSTWVAINASGSASGPEQTPLIAQAGFESSTRSDEGAPPSSASDIPRLLKRLPADPPSRQVKPHRTALSSAHSTAGTTQKRVEAPSLMRSMTQAADMPVIHRWCSELADHITSVSQRQCENAGFVDSGHRSVEGRVLPVAKRQYGAAGERRVLVLAGTHGDEPSAVDLAFEWLGILDAGDVAEGAWYFAPLMNPDGLFQATPTRTNANGVDLNRNMRTVGWEATSHAYWLSTDKDPRRYPGEQAASEPETRWLADLIESVKPTAIISLHAPYGLVDFDGHEGALTSSVGDLPFADLPPYPGSLGNYAGTMRGIPVVTVELPDAVAGESRKSSRALWSDLLVWLREHATEARILAWHESFVPAGK